MKPFIMCCREAASHLRLFSNLKPYTHFIDNVDVYSMQDLLDLQSGVLERHLRRTVDIFAKHIRECPVSFMAIGPCDDSNRQFATRFRHAEATAIFASYAVIPPSSSPSTISSVHAGRVRHCFTGMVGIMDQILLFMGPSCFRICYEQSKRVCPRCQRRKRRQSEEFDEETMQPRFEEVM